MPQPLHVFLFRRHEPNQEPFRPPFEQSGAVQIMGECGAWEEIQPHLHCRRIGAVVVDLDTGGIEANLDIIRRIAGVNPACPVVGVSRTQDPDAIIAAMRAGCRQFVRWPIDLDDLRAAIDRVRLGQASGSVSVRVCVLGAAGGAGATTVATNLAVELAAATGQRCALVDLNLQFGDAHSAFDASPRHSVLDVCRADAEVDATLLDTALEHLPCNVSLLAAPEKIIDTSGVSAARLEDALRLLGETYPFVVVDLPRDLSSLALAALGGADRVLIVSQLTIPQVRNATRLYQYLLEMGANDEHIEFVLNRCDAEHLRIKVAEVEKHIGRPVFARIANDFKRVGAARDLGRPLMVEAPNCPARAALQDMAQRMAGDGQAEAAGKTAGGGLLSLFRRRVARPERSAAGNACCSEPGHACTLTPAADRE